MTQSGARISGPELLAPNHDISQFDCGYAELDDWLRRKALASQGRSAQTYVVTSGGHVVAYYCLAAGSVQLRQLPSAKARRNLPEQVPIVVIGRLAVDARHQARGLGKALLTHAIKRALAASAAIGIRAFVVHAIDEKAARFYEKFGFVPFPTNSLTLWLPLKTAAKAL